MKKSTLLFGLISGIIVSVQLLITLIMMRNNPDFEGSMIIGFASMIVAMAFVFVAVKARRDKHNEGIISFGQALATGVMVAFIGSTLYVVTWLIEYYLFFPDFMEKYADHVLKQASESGLSAGELAAKSAEMASYKEMYKNPVWVILLTYMEILPIGLVVAIISALILKRKVKK